MDYAQQEAHLKNAAKLHKKKLEQADENGKTPVATCQDRDPSADPSDFGMFLPVFSAQVSAANPTATYEGKCFKSI